MWTCKTRKNQTPHLTGKGTSEEDFICIYTLCQQVCQYQATPHTQGCPTTDAKGKHGTTGNLQEEVKHPKRLQALVKSSNLGPVWERCYVTNLPLSHPSTLTQILHSIRTFLWRADRLAPWIESIEFGWFWQAQHCQAAWWTQTERWSADEFKANTEEIQKQTNISTSATSVAVNETLPFNEQPLLDLKRCVTHAWVL